MTNGVIIDAESGLPLIEMAGYQPNESANTYTTHMHVHMLTLSLTHTHFHFFQALIGALMHINLPPQQLTHPDIPLSIALDFLLLLPMHTHTHLQ